MASLSWRFILMLEKVIGQNKAVFIYGCGQSGLEYYTIIRKLFDSLDIFFIDSNIQKQREGVFVDGNVVKVFSPEFIINYEKEFYVIITSVRFCQEMIHKLELMGIASDRILLSDECRRERENAYRSIIAKRKPRRDLNFVVDLAEHCNLNCQNCDHFSPLANEHFTDIRQFECDIKRMSEIFGEDIIHVDLEGGEPLLNADVCKYIEIVHQYMPATIIKIFSNGLLLPKMNNEFWNTLRVQKVELEITQYPVNFDYEAVEKLAQLNGVKYSAYGGKSEKVSWHKPMDLDGKQDRYDSFNNCYLANGECTMLKNGRLYPCTLIPNLETFNRYFDRNLEVSEKDYIDIYSDVTKEEIYEFLCNPPRACRFCKVSEWTYGHKWATSRKEMREWT